MKNFGRFALCCLILVIFPLSGCSINLEPTPAATSAPALVVSLVPRATASGPVPFASPTIDRIPVRWSDLHLTGKLVYMDGSEKDGVFLMNIQVLDLITGEISIVFRSPEDAYIYGLTVSPDGHQLVMSYTPSTTNPATENPALYIMPLDGSAAPKLLFTLPTVDDEYFQPVWSPDGKTLYFSHIHYQHPVKNGQQPGGIELYRLSIPDGSIKLVAENAFWPNLSSDSARLVYVSTDQTNGTNHLVISNADGTHPQPVNMTGKLVPVYIDAPLFSADGRSILFSGVSLNQQVSAPTWLEAISGVTVASAHSIPSDWWSVPVSGGAAKQLTHIQTTNLFGSVSPDGKYIASYSGLGLFVMEPGATNAKMINNSLAGVPSTVNWIP